MPSSWNAWMWYGLGVVGHDDRLAVVGHHAPAVLEVRQPLQVVLAELVEQVLADLAVEHRIRMLGVAKDVGQLERRSLRDHAVEVGRTRHRDVDRAAARQVDQLCVGAERARRIDRDFDIALATLLHQLGELQQGHLLRTLGRTGVAESEFVRLRERGGGVGEQRQAGGDEGKAFHGGDPDSWVRRKRVW
jgi:hypothetical protein